MLPSTFVEGGLWDDIDVEISDIAWGKFNFAKQGAAQNLKLALIMELWPLAGLDEGQEPYQQAFSGGDLKYFVPSADDNGAYAVPVGDKSAINSNTNAAMFIMSWFESATPEQHAWLSEQSGMASGNCKGMVGLKMHVKRQPQKERKGLSAQEGDGDQPKSILLCTNIIALPGETESVVRERAEKAAVAVAVAVKPAAPASRQAAPKPAARPTVAAPASRAAVSGKANGAAVQGKPGATPAKPVPASSEWGQAAMEAKAAEALQEILAANDGLVEFAEVPKQGFRAEALKACPPKVRQQVCAIMYDEGWIAGQEGVVYDAATSTVALA
jgi:hypothetical protein